MKKKKVKATLLTYLMIKVNLALLSNFDNTTLFDHQALLV